MKKKIMSLMLLIGVMAVTGNEIAVDAWPVDGIPRVDHVPEYDMYSPQHQSSAEEPMQMTTTESGTNLVGVLPSAEWEVESETFFFEDSVTVNGYQILGKASAEQNFTLFDVSQLPETMYLDVPVVLQKPELPTGCESVALTMALMFEGFELEKTTIAREYLLYNRENDNMALGYIGDPFSESGAGCFAPALAATAMAYFEDTQNDYSVYDLTGSTLEELFRYVAIGKPVVIWGSMYMMEPNFSGEVAVFEGKEYKWYNTEHCMVLSGYDLKSQTVVIHDPLEGVVTRSMSEFERIFNLTGQNAIVLKQNY